MYCRQCGKPVNGNEEFCDDCKSKANSQSQNVYHTNATETNSSQTVNSNNNYNNNSNSYTTPPNYNTYQNNQNNYNQNPQYNNYNNGSSISNAKSKIAAGLLGIFLGFLGVHNFYLGYTGKAVGQLLLTLLSCGTLSLVSGIWGIAEGIMILTGSIDVDGYGNRLVD